MDKAFEQARQISVIPRSQEAFLSILSGSDIRSIGELHVCLYDARIYLHPTIKDMSFFSTNILNAAKKNSTPEWFTLTELIKVRRRQKSQLFKGLK